MSNVPNPSDINANPSATDGLDADTVALLQRMEARLGATNIAVYEMGIKEGMRRAHLESAQREKDAYGRGFVDGLSERFDPPKA